MNNYSSVPQQLKDIPNWVNYKLESRNGEITKIPYDPKTGRNAKANDPTTWGTFEQAVDAADPLNGSDYDGIGFEFGGTPFGGIDFDHLLDANGVCDPYSLAILNLLGRPYTEKSPSGTGFHSVYAADGLPKGKRKFGREHKGMEIYHGTEPGRFFTITGQKMFGDTVPKIADMSLPYLLISQSNDQKFKSLWLGDTTEFKGDDSSADFALMCRLAGLTQNDSAKMEKFFGASALGQRDKWTDREDYRQRTVKAAIDDNHIKASSQPAALEFHSLAVPDPAGEYVVAPLDGQKDGWFPLGDISLIGGASGTGKTTWIFELLHKQKQGYEVLGHRTHGRSFHVLAYDRGKNAFTRTMIRLNLLPSDIPTTPLPLAFGIAAVQSIINEIEKMDPIPGVIFIEGLDMLIDDANKKSIVSPFMRQLQNVAEHFHIALVCSVGAPKAKRGEEYSAKRDKISGSEAWGRNCETVCVLEFTDDDDGTAAQRSLTILPRNAKAEKFTLEFQDGRLVHVPPSADEEPTPILGRPSKETQEAIRFLEQELQDGPKAVKDLLRKAQMDEGISHTTFYKAAKAVHISKSDGQWELIPMHEEIGYLPDMGDMKAATV